MVKKIKKQVPLSGPDIKRFERKKVLKVLKTRHLSRGNKIKEFEEKFVKYIGVTDAIAVNSGTSALHLIVKALGFKKGDEVITTPFSFISSSNCLLMEDLKPVFVDIDPETYNIDPNLIEKKITKKTKAILVVDVFGQPSDIDKILKIAKKHKLQVIQDSCEALGARYKGERIGNKTIASIFAFYPNKQITTGEGGIILTSNKKIADLCRSLRNQGRNQKGEWLSYEILGYNYWMDEMSACLGITQLSRINDILNKRKKIAERYIKKLKNVPGISFLQTKSENKISWFVFPIKVNEKIRNKVLEYLQEQGVGCQTYFPSIHLEPFYKKKLKYKKGDFPISEKTSKQLIILPFYNKLKNKDMDYVVQKIKEAIIKFNHQKI